MLADGQPHNISIDVVSAETDHAINDNWYVSGNLQVVTDPSSKPTTGKITVYDVQPYAQTSTTGSVGANGDVNVTVSATRSIHIESEIVSGSGQYTYVTWTQNLEYSNTQYYLDDTYVQVSRFFMTCTLDLSHLHRTSRKRRLGHSCLRTTA